MKYLKSFKFWILFITAFYTIAGFLFIPWFLTNKVPTILKENVGINLEIKKAKFNPFTFELSLKDVLLSDLDEHPVINLKNIYIDYALLGLFEKTIFFKNIEIDSPKFYTRIYTDGKINLENIIPPSDVVTEEKKEDESSSMPSIILQRLNIVNGHIAFDDLRGKKPFSLNLGPYNFAAHDISTKEGDLNAHSFKTKIENDGELFWEGGMKLTPLSLYGKLDIKNLNLAHIYDYALPNIGADLVEGFLSIHVPYQIDLSKDIQANITEANLILSKIKILNKANKNSLVDVPQIQLSGFNLKYPEQDVSINSLSIDDSSIFTLLDKNYELNLAKAFAIKSDKKDEETVTKESNSSKPWNFLLKDTKINNAHVSFTDMTLTTPLKSELNKTSLHVKNISSKKTSPIEYKIVSTINKNSNLNLAGQIIQEPLFVSSDIDLKNLHVRNFIEYIKPYVNFDIKQADIDLKANVKAKLGKKQDIKLLANTSIKNLHINSANNEKLLTWKNLDINGITYAHEPMSLEIANLKLNKPYIRAHIGKDGSTNFSNLVKEIKTQKSEKKDEKTAPFKMKIGPMDLVDGVSDFSDLSLPFPFQTHIHDLNGHFSTLDFQTTTPSKLALNGKIDKYGYTDIKGVLSPFNIKENAQINLLFKNIDLSNMTPYSGKFVGYKIKSGKLSMDLKYDIKKARLVGDNQINIDTLTLGETVDSPDAVNLPLGLAIALLKDSKGQIDIDMPVKGDMDNPEFSYGGVIWRAVGNMITGIVTAPFKFLGAMLGVDGDELKAIDFDKGTFQITSTEHEKLENLNKILSKRPGIKLSITGKHDNVFDVLSIQERKFDVIIKEELAKSKPSKDAKKIDTYGIALKELYTKRFTLEKYEEAKKALMVDKKGKEIKLDIVAFNTVLQDKLISAIKIPEATLIALANQRASSIKDVLITEYKIDPKRINILAPKSVEAKRDRWIESALEIAI